MQSFSLYAVSPVDGRYGGQTQDLAKCCSEFALIRGRAMVEVEYFIALCQIPLPQLTGVPPSVFAPLRGIYEDFSAEDALQVKAIESRVNHDVKAVEYFLKSKFAEMGLGAYAEFVHFGLTSQDVTTAAVMLGIREAVQSVLMPALDAICERLALLGGQWRHIAILAHTHGQPASPTRLGKELRVFVERLQGQRSALLAVPFSTKFGGATGNFNAHYAAYPNIDWAEFANSFIHNTLRLRRTPLTTQIEPYDNLAALFDALKRLNVILTDLCRDVWLYISMGYFGQKIEADEVGSSAMPHKVNPIDFENAEGNLGVANALFEHFAAKLPVSRLQRDLTDSTVLRSAGAALAYSLIAYKAVRRGLGKIIVNKEKIDADLDQNWAVTAEGIQTILRREGCPNPYEALKTLTRTREPVTPQRIGEFIDALNVGTAAKDEMRALTPRTYIGIEQ